MHHLPQKKHKNPLYSRYILMLGQIVFEPERRAEDAAYTDRR